MAKGKHTPGPWEAGPIDGGFGVYDSAEMTPIPCEGPEGEANCYLIGAAPALKSALIVAERELRATIARVAELLGKGKIDPGCFVSAELEQIEAALAKSDGEPQ